MCGKLLRAQSIQSQNADNEKKGKCMVGRYIIQGPSSTQQKLAFITLAKLSCGFLHRTIHDVLNQHDSTQRAFFSQLPVLLNVIFTYRLISGALPGIRARFEFRKHERNALSQRFSK